jgi:predicted nucleic acid-binding protein
LTLYVDTSVLVAALTRETETPRTQAWLAAQAPDTLAISPWVATEFSSALSIKLRTGDIDARSRANSLTAFTLLIEESFVMLNVSAASFRTAALFADQSRLGLRAGDALHLAVCSEHGAELCTLDKRLSSAGPAIGVKTTLL